MQLKVNFNLKLSTVNKTARKLESEEIIKLNIKLKVSSFYFINFTEVLQKPFVEFSLEAKHL